MNTILAIVVVLAVGFWFGRRRGAADAAPRHSAPVCDWRSAPDDDRGRLKAYDCAVCAERGYAMGDAPPACKRGRLN